MEGVCLGLVTWFVSMTFCVIGAVILTLVIEYVESKGASKDV